MELSVSPLIQQVAHELNLTIHVNPLHGAQGIEIRKQVGNTDSVVCIGYYLQNSENVEIYRRTDSRRDIFVRTKLWFLWVWLIKPRLPSNDYNVVRVVPFKSFNDQLFVDLAKRELNA